MSKIFQFIFPFLLKIARVTFLQVSRIQPSRGPRSGGTDVTLYGTDLDAGSEVTVRFGDVDCRVIKRTASELTCRTASATTDGPLPLRINFDGSNTRLPISINFEFS